MNTGQVISGAGHLGLIAFALFGGAFQSEPLPFEVTEVTAISAEEFAALTQGESIPEAVANVDTPEPPQEGEAPALTSEADTPPERSEPEVAETPPPDEVPEPVEPAPVPQADVSDEPPVMQPPQEDTALLVPEESPRPQQRPAPRVAPEPVAEPEPDVQVDDVERQEVSPSEEPAEVVEEESEATAPEEATTEIVTEAEENDVANAAPAQSIRPRTRPTRPEPTETAEPAAPETDNSAVNDALAEALGQSGTSSNEAPQGPPLTAGEKDALRVAVQNCWNVGSLSSEALRTTVVVAVEMAENGKPVTSSIKMLSSSGGNGAAAKQAFEAARRAIIRCGSGGFDLPVEKYDHWRDIEMTFNPERMRIK
ncbi:energy transducer TonB [uncultured Roseovarius sp.]|uniref:energy transducer TonB n=1 Tax=uncultured Roseovarius sp. TaxID=293344 RepID=UPI0025CFD393|nr:energy transducer TonB [uncultured Roseovarius sp.]